MPESRPSLLDSRLLHGDAYLVNPKTLVPVHSFLAPYPSNKNRFSAEIDVDQRRLRHLCCIPSRLALSGIELQVRGAPAWKRNGNLLRPGVADHAGVCGHFAIFGTSQPPSDNKVSFFGLDLPHYRLRIGSRSACRYTNLSSRCAEQPVEEPQGK